MPQKLTFILSPNCKNLPRCIEFRKNDLSETVLKLTRCLFKLENVLSFFTLYYKMDRETMRALVKTEPTIGYEYKTDWPIRQPGECGCLNIIQYHDYAINYYVTLFCRRWRMLGQSRTCFNMWNRYSALEMEWHGSENAKYESWIGWLSIGPFALNFTDSVFQTTTFPFFLNSTKYRSPIYSRSWGRWKNCIGEKSA